MKFKRTSLIPLLLLPALLGGCSSSTDKSEPVPTVISNEEAINQLGGKVAGETESPTETLVPTEPSPIAAPEAGDESGKTNAPSPLSPVELKPDTTSANPDQSITPENYTPAATPPAP